MLDILRLPLSLTAGLVTGLGLALLIAVLAGAFRRDPHAEQVASGPIIDISGPRARRIGLGLAAALVVYIFLPWIVLAVVVAGLIGWGDKIFGGARAERVAITRAEGLASWIESLRDTIAGAAGLEQAIPATTINAAPSIRPSLNLLVDRLRVREPMPDALMKFADDLDDPSADLVVAALVLNARLRGPGLKEVLTALAVSARDELDVRRRVEASRRSTRRSVQVVVGVILVVAGGLVLFNQAYMEPYGTMLGQLILGVVVLMFAGAVFWMRRLAGVAEPQRFLIASAGVGR